MTMTHLNLEAAMNANDTTSARLPAKRSRLGGKVLCLALTLGASNAYAGMPVTDFGSIVEAFMNRLQSSIEFAKEATRWNEIKQQIDDVRAIFDAINYTIGLPEGEPLTKVDPKYLVAETCGQDAMGFNLKTVMSLAGIEAGDIKSQQKQICVNIRMMQNRKFNDSVDFLDKTMKQAEAAMLENFLSRVNGKNRTGAVQAAEFDAARLSNELNMKAQQWGTRMQSYDAYIATMQANQNVLAKAALKGNPKNKALGDIVQTVALKGALSID